MKTVVVTGSFDDIKSRHVRFLEEASKLGQLHVNLWSDEAVHQITGAAPKLTEAERQYFIQALRYVDEVSLTSDAFDADQLPSMPDYEPSNWAVPAEEDTAQKRAFCRAKNIGYHVIDEALLKRFPVKPMATHDHDHERPLVVVTGCFDWLHSGHVRFFEETSALGNLTVILGHDKNVLLLKGEGHPLFPEDERRYMVQSIRYVTQALVSSGSGWMDAEPEIDLLRPDIYAVNEDGDKDEKRAFCEAHGLEYVVLKRVPKEGLPKRESTALRGF